MFLVSCCKSPPQLLELPMNATALYFHKQQNLQPSLNSRILADYEAKISGAFLGNLTENVVPLNFSLSTSS